MEAEGYTDYLRNGYANMSKQRSSQNSRGEEINEDREGVKREERRQQEQKDRI